MVILTRLITAIQEKGKRVSKCSFTNSHHHEQPWEKGRLWRMKTWILPSPPLLLCLFYLGFPGPLLSLHPLVWDLSCTLHRSLAHSFSLLPHQGEPMICFAHLGKMDWEVCLEVWQRFMSGTVIEVLPSSAIQAWDLKQALSLLWLHFFLHNMLLLSRWHLESLWALRAHGPLSLWVFIPRLPQETAQWSRQPSGNFRVTNN